MNAFEKAQQLGKDLKTGAGKAALNLIPYVSLVEIAKVASFGAVKYPPGWTWTKSTEDWREKYGSAVIRHVMKWADPTLPDVDIDIDASTGDDLGSGISHMAHAAFNAMICLWHEARERRVKVSEVMEVIPWETKSVGGNCRAMFIELEGSLVEDGRGNPRLFGFPSKDPPCVGQKLSCVLVNTRYTLIVKSSDHSTVVCDYGPQ